MNVVRVGAVAAVLLALPLVASIIGASASVGTSQAAAAAPAGPRTPRPAFRPASSATPVPNSAMAAQPNPVLGYSISLPPTYRRALSVVDTDSTGRDFYTPRSEADDRGLCAREQQNGSESPERVADFKVVVYANPNGVSPLDFASTPNRRVVGASVEAATIDGRNAARIVHQPSGDTAYYLISANERLYEIAPLILEQPTTQPRGWLDQIATSFRAMPSKAPPAASQRRALCGA